MEKFLVFKEGTPQHEKVQFMYRNLDNWIDNVEVIEALVGCKVSGNMALDSNHLSLTYVPSNLQSQFRKNPDAGRYYNAKVKSEINKAWVKLAKMLELKKYGQFELALDIMPNVLFGDAGKVAFFRMFDKYYIEGEKKPYWEEIPDYLEEVSISDYYKIKANWAEHIDKQNKKKSAS